MKNIPIVLAHGVCRFDKFWGDALQVNNNDDPDMDLLHYFKGVRTMLKKNGYTVYHTNVSWAGGVDQRAADLKRGILKIVEIENCEKIHIIAHSMGGLDTRHMLFNDRKTGEIHHLVASVTTISTPHNGSSFADWGTDNLPYVIPVAQKLGLNMNAFYDLRTDRCRQFNENPSVVEFEKACEDSILFQTYAGKQNFWSVFDPLKLSYYIIEKAEGENDGLVSVDSAKWRETYFRGILENTDHLNELGWWDTAQMLSGEGESKLLDRIHRFYLEIVKALHQI
jgi:triacylglycerol lipase